MGLLGDIAVLPGSRSADWIFKQGGLGGDSTDPFGEKSAAEQQLAARTKALEQQKGEIDASRGHLQTSADQARGDITGGYNAGINALGQSYGEQQGYYGQAEGALTQGRDASLESLAGGYGQARGDLGGLTALQGYGAGATQSVGAGGTLSGLMGRGDALSARMDQPVNLEADPGYQFRLEQGEQAINRAASAQGGRHGGRTLKALSDHASDRASQEYGAAFARKQAGDQQQLGLLGQQYGAASTVDQQRLGADLAAQRNQMGLASMGYGAQGDLARMSYGYGQDVSGVQGQYGTGLAGLRGTQAGAAGAQGSALAGLNVQQGQDLGNIAINQGNQNVGLSQSMIQGYNDFADYGGMVAQAEANTRGKGVEIVGGLLSDRRLKADIEDGSAAAKAVLSTIKPQKYRYQDARHGDGPQLGVMAQDLERSPVGAGMVLEGPDGKVIDPIRAVSALLGIVAHLHAEVEELKRKAVEG